MRPLQEKNIWNHRGSRETLCNNVETLKILLRIKNESHRDSREHRERIQKFI